MSDGICRHGSQHYVTSLKENSGLGLPAVRSINQMIVPPCFSNQSLCWLLIYGQKSNYPVHSDDIAKTDMD
jgi:hypothetical protein